MNTKQLYNQYVEHTQKIADIKYSIAVLQWDQETYMPELGATARAKQVATLNELAHSLAINENYGSILKNLLEKNDLEAIEKKNVELSYYDFSKQKKYTSEFVRKLSETTSQSFNSWIEARKQNDFAVFKPSLEKLIELKKEETYILGFAGNPYNALLNEYERGCTVNFLDDIFQKVEKPLAELLELYNTKETIDGSFLHQHFDKDEQWKWGMYLIEQLGFNLKAGRQDISEHPFTINFCANDVRITTRIDEQDFSNMTWSCIHEVGHALYEQGLPNNQYGLPCGEYTSLSIHESQSRFWENNIGRSYEFWYYYFPKLKNIFPNQLKNVDLLSFYKAINKIQPSLIRTEADELTYHLHIKIRYEIEKHLFSSNCSVNDIASIWKEQYKKYLNVIVQDDKNGCLQDVHWSHGSFGYFPTYSLGSFYAAQFMAKVKKDIFSIDEDLMKGNTINILNWLRKNIHAVGRRVNSDDLCRTITGEGLNTNYFIEYLKNKIIQQIN